MPDRVLRGLTSAVSSASSLTIPVTNCPHVLPAPPLGQAGRTRPAPRASDGAVPKPILPAALDDTDDAWRHSELPLGCRLFQKVLLCASAKLPTWNLGDTVAVCLLRQCRARSVGIWGDCPPHCPHREARAASCCYPLYTHEEVGSWRSKGPCPGPTAVRRQDWDRHLTSDVRAQLCRKGSPWGAGEVEVCEISGLCKPSQHQDSRLLLTIMVQMSPTQRAFPGHEA